MRPNDQSYSCLLSRPDLILINFLNFHCGSSKKGRKLINYMPTENVLVRPLKPENELTESGRYRRRRKQRDPDWYKKDLERAKRSYIENKTRLQYAKKIKATEQREIVIRALGSHCASCGVPYNPHSKRRNLEIDHKKQGYLQSKSVKRENHRQVLTVMDEKIDPNTLFALLCHTCHMIVTHIRHDPQKGKAAINYLIKNGTIPS